MRRQPDVISISVGGNSERWYHLNERLFPPHDSYAIPALSELGLARFAYVADVFQDLGRALRSNVEASCPTAAEFADTYDADQAIWLSVARLWQTAGEAGELVVAALAEAAGILGDLELADRTSPALAGFVIEGAAQYVVGLGHNIANIGLRLAVDNDACRARLAQVKRTARWVNEVRSGGPGRDAWIFHASAHDLADALRSSRTGPARLVRVAARLEGSRAWKAMSETRHAYFHRVRYGYATGGDAALEAAQAFHAATVDAARACARAAPALYHCLLESRRIRRGPGRSMPLMGSITVSEWSAGGTRKTPDRDLFDAVPFRG